MIVTRGWMTVPAPIVISPSKVQSSHTVAPGIILMLQVLKDILN